MLVSNELQNKGFKLFLMAAGYLLVAAIYFRVFQNNRIGMIIGLLFVPDFLILWFYMGYRLKKGFLEGIIVGMIGASGGLATILINLILSPVAKERGLYIMVPWSYPFWGFFEVLSFSEYSQRLLLYFTVFLAILLTSCGSFIGKLVEERK